MGGGILLVQSHTIPQLLSQVYPEYKWEQALFTKITDIWNDEQTANYFVEKLKKSEEEELLFLQKIIRNMGLKGHYSLIQLLKSSFPNYVWATFLSGKKAQYVLKECLKIIFPFENNVLLEEYKHPEITNLELDYFYPHLNLAFEYQVCRKEY